MQKGILVIDGNRISACTTQYNLVTLGLATQRNVLLVNDTTIALRKLLDRSVQWEFVLCDWLQDPRNMSEMQLVTQARRQRPDLQETGFVIVALCEDVVRMRNAFAGMPAIAVLPRPFTEDELVLAVKQTMAQTVS